MKTSTTIDKEKIIPYFDYFFYMTHIYAKKYQNLSGIGVGGSILVYGGLLTLHEIIIFCLVDITYPFIESSTLFALEFKEIILLVNALIIFIIIAFQLLINSRYKAVINFYDNKIQNIKKELKIYGFYVYFLHFLVIFFAIWAKNGFEFYINLFN